MTTPQPPQAEPARELTDEKIADIYQAQTGFCITEGYGSDIALLDFARAVLAAQKEIK